MRLLFKWAIPWSDSLCHTQPHPISPRCTQAESTRPAGAEGPLALRSTECGALLLPWAEGHAGTRLHLKKCLHLDISFKKQILCFSAWNHPLFSPAICTIHFGACQRATVALLIVLFTCSQGYSHCSAMCMFYSAKLSTKISCFWALLFQTKNNSLRNRAALHWGSTLQTEAKPCSFSLPQSCGLLHTYPWLLHTGRGRYELLFWHHPCIPAAPSPACGLIGFWPLQNTRDAFCPFAQKDNNLQ